MNLVTGSRGSRLVSSLVAVAVALGVSLVGAVPASAAALPLPAGNVLYYADYSGGAVQQITGTTAGTIDVSTVCAATCSATPTPTMGGFYDQATDSLYLGNNGGAMRFTLYRVPLSGPAAGEAVEIGADGSTDVYGLARGPQGAFGIVPGGGAPALVSVDLATGRLTPVGPLGVEPGGILYAFTYDRVSGRYYTMERSNGNLYSIDVTTGAATLVGDTGLAGSYGLTVDGDGTLWNLSPASALTSFTVSGSTISVPTARGALSGFATVTPVMKAPVPSYTVAYDGNGSTGGSAPVDANSPYLSGSTVTVKTPGTLTRTGYQFRDWLTTPTWQGGVTHAYAPGATFTASTDTTLYARWGGGPLEFRATPGGPAVSSIAFADMANGQQASLTVYVRNVGSMGVDVSNVTGNGDGVSRTGGTCSSGGGTIAPYNGGATADCTYTFTWGASSSDISYPFSVNYFTSSTVTLTGHVVVPDTNGPVVTGPAAPPYVPGSLEVAQYTADEPVTWSLTGADAALFTIGEDGTLSFLAQPSAREYAVTVLATDAAENPTATDVTVLVPAPAAPASVRVALGTTSAVVRVVQGASSGIAVTSTRVTLGGSSISCTIPAGGTSCTLTGLPVRTSYVVSAVARGATGSSSATTVTVTVRTVVVRSAVYFAPLSSSLSSTFRARLRTLVAHPPTGGRLRSVAVVGYVQRSGDAANDRSLSLARARAVASYLKATGVRAPISTAGRGVLGVTRWSRAATVTLTYVVTTQTTPLA